MVLLYWFNKNGSTTMSKRIHVVISESQKGDWDDFAEKTPGIDDRSDLIRTAVSEYIKDAESDSELPAELEERLDEVLVQFEHLEGQLNFVNEAFDDIERTQLDEETVEDIVEFYSEMIRDEIREIEEEAVDEEGKE